LLDAANAVRHRYQTIRCVVARAGDLGLTPRWTLLTKFDGEFAPTAQTYAGSATLRYIW